MTSISQATQRTPKQTSQHHLLWLKLLSAACLLKIANSSGWGRPAPPVHDQIPLGDRSYLGWRFTNAVFTHACPNPIGSQKFRFSHKKLLELLSLWVPSRDLEYLQLRASRVAACSRTAQKSSRSWLKWMLKNRKGKKLWSRRRGGNCWWLLFKEGNNYSEARTGLTE